MSEVSEPVFDAGGKYLYFFASTDAGPVKQWFSMSNADMVITRSLYLAVLAKGVESPLKPESDEEAGEKPRTTARETTRLAMTCPIGDDGRRALASAGRRRKRQCRRRRRRQARRSRQEGA